MTEKKPVKAVKLVLEALRNLKADTGFTPREIIKCIQSNHGTTEKTIKCIYTALKRGTECGILREEKGRFDLKSVPTAPLLRAKKIKDEDLGDLDFRNACKRKTRVKRKSRLGGKRRSKSRHRRSRKGRSRCGKRRGSRRRSSSRRRRHRSRGRSGKRRKSSRRSRNRRGRKSVRSGRRTHGRHSRRHRSRGRRGSRRRRAKCRC